MKHIVTALVYMTIHYGLICCHVCSSFGHLARTFLLVRCSWWGLKILSQPNLTVAVTTQTFNCSYLSHFSWLDCVGLKNISLLFSWINLVYMFTMCTSFSYVPIFGGSTKFLQSLPCLPRLPGVHSLAVTNVDQPYVVYHVYYVYQVYLIYLKYQCTYIW